MVTFKAESTVSLENFWGGDESVARAAWVSQSSDSRTKDTKHISGLINFLIKNQHMSPLEHSGFTFYIQTPLFVRSEIQRHRSSAFNERSARYSEMPPTFYVPSIDRPVLQTGKVGAYTFDAGDEIQKTLAINSIQENSEASWDRYQAMLNAGVAKEVARDVLPVNLFTEFWMTVSTRNLMHFLNLRTAPDALFEIRDVAGKMEEIFEEKMPITAGAWKANL